MNSVDPHEPPLTPALQYHATWSVEVIPLGGPDRIYDQAAADPDWLPKRVGFVMPAVDVEPLRWEGDDA